MDIKVYDQKVRELQGNLTFLEDLTKNSKAKLSAALLEKIKKFQKVVESTYRVRHSIGTITRLEKAMKDIKAFIETKTNDPLHAIPVEKDEECYMVSDSPTSVIEIPSDHSDDRDHKARKEKDSRYDDNRRHRSDDQRSKRSDKYSFSRHDSGDRNRSRYDQHERSKSRDRYRDRYRSDRRDRTDSLEIGSYVKSDRNRSDSRDSRDNTWKRYDDESDRVSSLKTPSSTLHRGKPSKNFATATVTKSSSSSKSSENRGHQPQQHHPEWTSYNDPILPPRAREPRVQAQQNSLRMQPFSTSPIPPRISNYPPSVQPTSGFTLNTYPNHFPNQPNANPLYISPRNHPQLDPNLISITPLSYKIQRPAHHHSSIVSSMNMSPTTRFQYQPPSFPKHRQPPSGIHNPFRPSLNYSVDRQKNEQSCACRPNSYYEKEPAPESTTYNDPILPPRAREPLVQPQQNSLRMQPFSTSPIPPRISNYPPIIQPTSGFTLNTYPNHFPNQPNANPLYMSPPNHPQLDPNLISITPHSYKSQRPAHHHSSIVSSMNMSPTTRFQYQPPSFPKHRQPPSGIHNQFRRPNNEKEPAPQTSIEYKRSIQATVSSTSEKVTNKATASTANSSTSHYDKGYRSRNYSVISQSIGSKFRSPKKTINESANVTHTANTSTINHKSAETLSSSVDQEKVDVPKTTRQKRKTDKLEKLKEDIRSDRVLQGAAKQSTAVENFKPKEKSKYDVAIDSPIKSSISLRPNTTVCEPFARSFRTETTKKQSRTTLDLPKETPTPVVKISEKEEFANISAAAKINISNDVPTTKPYKRAQSVAFVESVTKGSLLKRKRPLNEKLEKNTVIKKAKNWTYKNINPEFHSLNKHVDCQLCEKSVKLAIVSHYVNEHPHAEVLTCRLAPNVADALRKRKQWKKAELIVSRGLNYCEFSNLCYFCNETKCYPKAKWINHIARHTGYYQFECNGCSLKFWTSGSTHICKGEKNIRSIAQPQFEENTLKAFLCDLCNFVRFHQNEIEKHLKCEHEITELNKFKEVILLVIPNQRRKKVRKTVESEEEDEGVAVDEDVKTLKRPNLDKNSAKSVNSLRSRRVINTEVFISAPKQDDGLFDKDTMKLMKDMSFSVSKDGECATRSNRSKSIAQTLSEGFNSTQEGSASKLGEEPQIIAEPLDPMTCDQGISIIRATVNEDSAAEETNQNVTALERVFIRADKDSSSSTLLRDTSSDDEWDCNSESYSSNDTDVVNASQHTDIQCQLNQKNVGISDTVARLRRSISSQGTSSVKSVEKLSEMKFHHDKTVKVEVDTDTISTTSKQQVETYSQGKGGTTKPVDEETPMEEERNITAAIVDEAMELDAVDAGDAPDTNHSVNFKGSGQSSQFPIFGLGDLSLNADSTNSDVDMLDLSVPAEIFTRIDNIGYTRSTATIGGGVTFCCLIGDCCFESAHLAYLICHINEHSVEWGGFCYSCNAQINKGPMQVQMEFMHMRQKHTNKSNENEITKKANAARKPYTVDKFSKLKEKAQAGKISISPKASTSTCMNVDSKCLKIANVKTVTRTPERKSSEPSMLKAKVVSLGAVGKEYNDSKIDLLKSWQRNPTNKSRKNCKKMLRDTCLYALYKCMDIDCAFSTENADDMLTHLRYHENGSEEPCWLECAYCDTVADSCPLLVRHIQDEHQSSIFQCPYCFYRSCDAYNVVVHLKQFHASHKISVLVCNGKPRMYATEKAFIEKSLGENIRPLRCTEGCNNITYVMDNFVKHMRYSSVHNERFKCPFCGYNTLISETAKHFLVHSVGVYECVYCHYGINDVESIQNHMCNAHPSKLLYICVRLTRKDRIMSEEQLRSMESTMIFDLGQMVDNNLFQRCPFTEFQLSYKNPVITSKASVTTVVSSPLISSTYVNTSPPSTGIIIASVVSISRELFSSDTETVATTNTKSMLSDVLSYKDLEKDYMADDWDEYLATLPETITSQQISSVAQPRVELPDNENKASTSTTLRTDLMQEEIDNAAYILVKGTGLEGHDLYRCSFTDCDEKSKDIFDFSMHLVKHNASATGFKCYHCNVVSKNIVDFKCHIKVHGIHRYFCYYCNYTSANVKNIRKHVEDTHSLTHVTTIPLNPKKKDNCMFVMCHGGLRQDELNRFCMGLIERNRRQLTLTKTFYSPEDIELLPRQAIFSSSIACAICLYTTKVRSNMYRHLVGHKSEKSVPKIDPVNPVPCLDTGKKHFDKTINMAYSSNESKETSTPYEDSSAFVPEHRRFVCNARKCQHRNISEDLLKCHLTTFHPSEKNYKCPHCNSPICQKMNADKVILHLRMHGLKIYKCTKCLFTHHVKSLVEKHMQETHIGVADEAELTTRFEATSAAPEGQPKVSKWKCNLCNDLFLTKKRCQVHIRTSHSVKFQYQCDICPVIQSNKKTNIQKHINITHPNMGCRIKAYYMEIESTENDNTPIWRRDDPNKIKNIRGILFEEENVQ